MVDLSLATVPSKRTCKSVVKELVQHPPLHVAIKHCCNYSRVTFDCINGHRLVEGDRVRRCFGGKLLGNEPRCRFPKGRELIANSLISLFSFSITSEGILLNLKFELHLSKNKVLVEPTNMESAVCGKLHSYNRPLGGNKDVDTLTQSVY